jgi:peptidoglycan lytic transglycosylase D
MRVKILQSMFAPAIVLALVSTACQTAQRPTALLPPAQANVPLIAAAPRPQAPQDLPSASASAQPSQQNQNRPTESQQDQRQQNQVQAPKSQTKPTQSADRVALIAQIDTEYQSGQENFKAGRLEAAKQNFSNAFDLLTKGPLDVKSDPHLQQKLDQVVAGLKSVDLQDQQQNEASAEQASEPAPIDEANEAAPPVDLVVKARAAAEVKATKSDLPLMLTDPVAAYINYFSGRGHDILERALVRSGRYKQMIQSTFRAEGVPQDLIYLAQAESGFHPQALSRAGARGMWQFMAGRGSGYGLERNKWIDDRQDPEKATRAAARHLHDLYNQFGDWYLAMAAYNSGPGTVQSAVKRTGYADFWELYKRNVLPKETRNYVPIILAMTIMAKNPGQYGLDHLVMDTPSPYDTLRINYPVDLRLVAQCVDATPAELQDLNPSLLRWTTPEDSEFELHLPAGTRDQYLHAIAVVPQDMRVWWRYHKVAPGDTLASIAHTYRTTAQAILKVNALDPEPELPVNTKLVVPIAPGRHATSEDAQAYSRRFTRYTVHRGDTAASVADRFGVPTAMVQRWNGLRGNSLRGRRVLFIHLAVSPGSQGSWAATSKPKSKKSPHATASRKAGPASIRGTLTASARRAGAANSR